MYLSRLKLNKAATSLALTALCSLSLLSGCNPRGETRTLSEVLASAQEDFKAQLSNVGANADDVKGSIVEIQTNLEMLINEQSDRAALSKAASEIGAELATLTSRAGYTSRPALTELSTQYRQLEADAAEGAAQLNRLKLMASRTYSALASELETTRFMVLPLSPK